MSTLTFEFRAVDKAGTRRRGSTAAHDETDAYRRVTALGLIPLSIRPAKLARARRIKLKEIAHFTSQLGVLIGARVSIGESLIAVGEMEPDPTLRAIIMDVAARIESGENLADALGAHRAVFGDTYIETIRAAEKTGNLVKVMEYLSEMLERSQETAAQVKGAIMYPACVLTVMAIGVTFLVGYVVPKFTAMYESRGVQLPGITQFLQNVGLSVQHYWWAYGLLIGGSIFGLRRAWRTPSGRSAIDRFLHKVPAIRGVLKGLAISRFSRVLGVSLGSGLGLIESLELSGRASGRPMLLDDVQCMVRQVRSGGRLTEVLNGCTYLTPFCKRMMSAGEQSAELPRMCLLVAKHYDRETAHTTKNLSTIIEPIMIVGIALIVLIVALAIFLPMWNMVNLVG
ncbi:MAG: type II secretion system F family protein [Phycisphaerales bacterium]